MVYIPGGGAVFFLKGSGGVDLGKRLGEALQGVEGGKTTVKMYCREKNKKEYRSACCFKTREVNIKLMSILLIMKLCISAIKYDFY